MLAGRWGSWEQGGLQSNPPQRWTSTEGGSSAVNQHTRWTFILFATYFDPHVSFCKNKTKEKEPKKVDQSQTSTQLGLQRAACPSLTILLRLPVIHNHLERPRFNVLLYFVLPLL